MKKMKKSVFFLFLFINLSLAFASEEKGLSGPVGDVMIKLSQQIPKSLIAKNITEIEELDILLLNQELESVKWLASTLPGFLSGSGGIRTTSVYVVKRKEVIINIAPLQNYINGKVVMKTWALHEALGALGYEDEDYQKSIALSLLSEAASDEEALAIKQSVSVFFKDFRRPNTERLYKLENGGSTVIGGGGDVVLTELKRFMLKRYWSWIAENREKEDISRRLAQRLYVKLFAMPIRYKLDEFSTLAPQTDKGTLVIPYLLEITPINLKNEAYIDSVLSFAIKSLRR